MLYGKCSSFVSQFLWVLPTLSVANSSYPRCRWWRRTSMASSDSSGSSSSARCTPPPLRGRGTRHSNLVAAPWRPSTGQRPPARENARRRDHPPPVHDRTGPADRQHLTPSVPRPWLMPPEGQTADPARRCEPPPRPASVHRRPDRSDPHTGRSHALRHAPLPSRARFVR